MTTLDAKSPGLPEPSLPFPRWFGGAAAAIWAVGVQSAGGPWDKLLAILTPGVGYLAGHGLAMLVAFSLRLLREYRIKKLRASIKELEVELTSARQDKDAELESLVVDLTKRAKDDLAAELRNRHSGAERV